MQQTLSEKDLVGGKISYKTVLQGDTTGTILAFDNSSSLLCVSQGTEDGKHFELVLANTKYMKELTSIVPRSLDDDGSNGRRFISSLEGPTFDQKQTQLEQNIQILKDEDKNINYDAPPAAQAIYDALMKRFSKIEWDKQDNKIVILNEIIVKSPYTEKDVGSKHSDSVKDSDFVQEVSRVVANVRQQLGLAPQ